MASERTTKKSSSATSPRSGRQQQQQQQHQVVVMETGSSSVGAEQMIHVISPTLPGTSTAGSQGAVTLPIALAQGGLTIPVSFTTSQNSVSKLCRICLKKCVVRQHCTNYSQDSSFPGHAFPCHVVSLSV